MLLDMSNFYRKSDDPLPAFRFFIEVDGITAGAFTQCSGIKMQVQTIQARGGGDLRGVQEYVPVLTSYAPVSLTKGVFGDDAFVSWITAASASRFLGPTGQNLYRTVNIVAPEGGRGGRGIIWTLRDAMPIGYELSPMDSMRSEMLSESVTFAVMGVERTVSSIRYL